MEHNDCSLEELSVIEKAAMLSGASEWDSRGNDRAGIPSFVMSDGPHGVRRQLGEGDHLGLGQSKPATCFPTAGTVANSWDPKLAEKMGQALGKEAHDLDVNVLLGPGMNIKRNPLCGRNFEYYSEDPQVAGHMAAGLITGIQSNGVSACPKHFAVNSQELRRQASNSVVDERTMRELYLTAFEIAVREAKPKAIMTSYNRVNGVYAHENKHLLQDILRGEWGFEGAVISDWGGSNSAVAAAQAGGSLEMPSPGLTSVRQLANAVALGELSQQDLDARAGEVAKLAQYTHFEGVGRNGLLSADVARSHHDLARHVAEQTSVLLKNDGHVLPLQQGAKVAVIGDMAKTPRFQGSGSSKVNATHEENILDELNDSDSLTVVGYQQGYERQGAENRTLLEDAVALAACDETDAVIAVVGLDERSESEGLDRSTMAVPDAQNALIRALKGAGKPIIVVLIAGSAVEVPWIDEVAAVLYIGLSGQAGASAAVNVLTGKVNPSGHLAETWPISYADCPSSGWYPATGPDAVYREGPFVGYRYYETAGIPVRFPFGYGLSYSTFVYGSLTASRQGVTFTVTNTSDMPGSTVAQLYVRGPKDGLLRPSRELKGFAKITLGAHEQRTVHIDYDRYTFRHFDVSTDSWQTETGQWNLYVGENVETLPLETVFDVSGDVETKSADPRLGAYATGHVKDVTDKEMNALFGYDPTDHETRGFDGLSDQVFGVNDPISAWISSKGFTARTVAKTLIKQEAKKRQKTGAPDLNTLFILNMPPRAMSKMTGGLIDAAMAEDIVRIANGHTFRGAGSFIAGYFRNRTASKRLENELHHD
jgi:beta-glucosidase